MTNELKLIFHNLLDQQEKIVAKRLSPLLIKDSVLYPQQKS